MRVLERHGFRGGFDAPIRSRRLLTEPLLLIVLTLVLSMGSTVARAEEKPEPACAASTETTVECLSLYVPTGAFPSYQGSGEKGGFSPEDLRSAYKLPSIGGSGQTIAIVDAFDGPNAEADLKTYRSHYGLSECTTANGCFQKVNQKGEAKNYPTGNVGWSLEISLDLDMASAICPGCHILLVEATSNSFENMAGAEDEAATLGGTEISDSWGGADSSSRVAEDSHYSHPGIPILVASGDSGYGTEFPATVPTVIAVGGTNLRTAENTRKWTETVWSGTGSGCSALQTKPKWQTDASCSKRTDNDVAAVASPETPVSVYDSYGYGGWVLVGGTSASTPIMAGVEALSGSTARSLGAEAFYKAGPAGHLFDVTEGKNGSCGGSYLCEAKTGYDGPTGWGTPDGPLVSAPEATTQAASSIKTTEATLNASINPSGASTTYHFEYGKTTSYGTSVPVPSESVGSGTEAVAKSKTITGLSPETIYHYRVVAENSEGTTYGKDQEFSSLAVSPSLLHEFGGWGSGNGEFQAPHGIAVDQNGDVWASDYELNRVQEFTESGEYLRQFGGAGTGNGQFTNPVGIAITASGNLWVVDSGNHRVQEFNSKGEYLGKFGTSGTGNGQFSTPWDIAIAPDGSLWVTDLGNDNVQKFTASGEFLLKSGSEGTGNGQFKEPAGIATESDGSVWVVDHGNNRMQKLSSSGSFLAKFGSKGSGEAQFNEVGAVAVKSTGNLLVLDGYPNHRIQEFSQSGQQLAEISDWVPEAIALGHGGKFFVTEGSSRRIQAWGQPAAPEATTQAASSIKTTEATLNASINPSGASTTYHFEYGKTTSYGTSVPVPSESVGSGTEAVAKSKTITGLSPETIYHYRVVAENSEGTTYGKDITFTPGTAAALSGLPVIEPFNGSSESLSDFSGNWLALPWAAGGTPKGQDTATGWGPVAAYPTVNGAFYGTTLTDTGSGIAAVATMAVNPGNSNRYFSIWLDLSSEASARTGYELRFTDVSAGVYTVSLNKWQEGTQSVLASKSSYSFANGNSFALVDRGGTVSAWTNTGSGFAELLSASDSAFGEGNAALEGSGNFTRLTNFKAGSL